MKRKHRILSIIMIICLLLSGSSLSVFAASTNYVMVPVTKNYAEAQEVLNLINKQRTKRGLCKLKLDSSLCKSAEIRAAELTIYIPETSPHKRPNGKPAKAINKRIIYECCAEGYPTPKEVVKGWMNSPPHKKGILLKNARSVGIACVTTQNGGHFWTLEFSATKAKKVLKSTSAVTKTYKITALTKYLKKKRFTLTMEEVDPLPFYADYTRGDDIAVYQEVMAQPTFINNYGYMTRLRASDFTWKSSDPAVAEIDSSGKFLAKKEGVATITAQMTGPLGYKVQAKVRIVDPYSHDVYGSDNIEDYEEDYDEDF